MTRRPCRFPQRLPAILPIQLAEGRESDGRRSIFRDRATAVFFVRWFFLLALTMNGFSLADGSIDLCLAASQCFGLRLLLAASTNARPTGSNARDADRGRERQSGQHHFGYFPLVRSVSPTLLATALFSVYRGPDPAPVAVPARPPSRDAPWSAPVPHLASRRPTLSGST